MQKKRNVVAIVSLAVIIAAVLVFVVRQPNRSVTVNLDPFAAVGEVMADETSALLGGKGQVVIVTYDTAKMPMPVAAAQLKAFQQRLKKGGGITVKAIETPGVNAGPGMPAWGGSQYGQLVQRHAGVDAIVVFLGPPFFSDAELRQLPAQLPKGIVFGGGNPSQPLRKLFERGVVEVAVVPRLTPPASVPASAAKTSRAQFDQQFQVMRKDTVGTLGY